MNKKYVVRLTSEERRELESMVRSGKRQAYRIKHANILLAVDADGPKMSDSEASKAFRSHTNTVCNLRQRFVEQGLDAALSRKEQERASRTQIFDGEKEARLIAIACGQPPEGRSRWTLDLLADRLVELNVVESVSGQTVRRTLKKTNFSLTGRNVG